MKQDFKQAFAARAQHILQEEYVLAQELAQANAQLQTEGIHHDAFVICATALLHGSQDTLQQQAEEHTCRRARTLATDGTTHCGASQASDHG